MEQPKIIALVQHLRQKDYTDLQIIDVLCSIITQQMLYGGALEDKIYYFFNKR